jgi:hypothetical protein
MYYDPSGYSKINCHTDLIENGNVRLTDANKPIRANEPLRGRAGSNSINRNLDDILRNAKRGETKSSKVVQYEKTGGFSEANIDFNSLNPLNIRDISKPKNNIKTGITQDGLRITVRSYSKEGRPTIEIMLDSKRRIKIRYGK